MLQEKMSLDEVIDYLNNEAECVKRGSTCNRDCLNCELVREDKKILQAYDIAIKCVKAVKTDDRTLKYFI